jgi:protein-S-isoprenylcysteine O-methyltransferase Ste14
VRVLERVFVWGGGAIFAASLGLTVWRYLGAFGTDLPGPRVDAALIDILLLTIFATHHSLFARSWMKARIARVIPERLLRSFYVWIASILLIAVCVWWQPVGGTLYHADGPAAWPFAIAQLAGLGLAFEAVRAIRALELAGIVPFDPSRDVLKVAGVFRIVRHPLYLGFALAVAATSHMTGDRLIFAAVAIAYMAVAIVWEERGLAATFGESYAHYRAAVRWRFIPWIY